MKIMLHHYMYFIGQQYQWLSSHITNLPDKLKEFV